MTARAARNRGFVLFAVLAAVAVIGLLALETARLAGMALEQTRARVDRVRTILALQEGLAAGKALVRERLAAGLPVTGRTLTRAGCRVRVADESGKIPLGSLCLADGSIHPVYGPAFSRLTRTPPAFLDMLADWTDPDSAPRPQGCETLLCGRIPVKNAPVARLGELRALARHLALPPPEAAGCLTPMPVEGINANTAPEAVWLALSEWIRPADVRALLREREKEPFGGPEALSVLLPARVLEELRSVLVFRSRYFSVEVRGEGRPQGLRLYLMAVQPPEGGIRLQEAACEEMARED